MGLIASGDEVSQDMPITIDLSGQVDNIKITFPADLALAELILSHQERER